MKLTDQRLRLADHLGLMVAAENMAQVEKWGVQSREPEEWLVFLGEEFCELFEQYLPYLGMSMASLQTSQLRVVPGEYRLPRLRSKSQRCSLS